MNITVIQNSFPLVKEKLKCVSPQESFLCKITAHQTLFAQVSVHLDKTEKSKDPGGLQTLAESRSSPSISDRRRTARRGHGNGYLNFDVTSSFSILIMSFVYFC